MKKILKFKQKYLNLFDALLILGIFLSAIFFALFFLRRSKNIEVIVKITNQNVLYAWDTPPNWFSFYFQEGMAVRDGLGRKRAEVKKIYRYDTGANNKAVYLTLDFKADYSKAAGKFSYEGRPLIIGAPIKIEFPNMLVEGLVTHIEDETDGRKVKEMLVETQLELYTEVFPETTGVPNFVTEAVNIGDEVKDSLGNVLITIVDKKVEPAKKIIVDYRGNVFVGRDPLKKDLFLTMRLRVKEIDNVINGYEYYLFDDMRVKIGEKVPLHLKNISFYPTVIKIVEVK